MPKRKLKRRRTSVRKKKLTNRQVARENQTFDKTPRSFQLRRSTYDSVIPNQFINYKVIKKSSTRPLIRTGLVDTRQLKTKNIWKPTAKLPQNLKICLQRKRRREILFANSGSGKRIIIKHSKRFTDKSFIRC